MTEKEESSAPEGWPNQVRAVHVASSIDGTLQPMLHYSPSSPKEEKLRPLLVVLHTWSSDYQQAGGQTVFAKWCMEQDWHLVHPNFRGPNWTAEACGSDLAAQDVLDAVDHVRSTIGFVDENRIHVVGVSGGGHMALLLASRFPQKWAGVSAWAAISDLEQWWKERVGGNKSIRKYARHVEMALGGRPDGTTNAKVLEECRKRSPATHLPLAGTLLVNLDINAGIHDGRTGGSVPFSHSLVAFDASVPSAERLGEEFITEFYKTQKSHEEPSKDILYGTREIHFRRIHENARVTIFEGGHEILHEAALNWLSCQTRGTEAIWTTTPEQIHRLTVSSEETQSGK
jgi:poly(3-hydroxybutyrate) depolymerase